MRNPMLNLRLVFATALLIGANGAHAQSSAAYPIKPVRLMTGEPGGNADFHARMVAQGISPALGQPVVVDNRPNGIVLFEAAYRAAPDGYSFIVYNNAVWLL